MLRRALGGVAAIAISSCLAVAAQAQAQAQDIKLYVFSSGALTIGKGILQNLGPLDPPIQVPVGFFVIKHPKGNVLFDTGNNDRIIKDPSYWGASFNDLKPINTPDVAIDAQLEKIGLKPDDIKYRCRQPPASGPWRQRQQVPQLDDCCAAGRDPERLLAEGPAPAVPT